MHRRLFCRSQTSRACVHETSLNGRASPGGVYSSRSTQKRLCTRSPTQALGANFAHRARLFFGDSIHSRQSWRTSVQYSPSTRTIPSAQDGFAEAGGSDGDAGSLARLAIVGWGPLGAAPAGAVATDAT